MRFTQFHFIDHIQRTSEREIQAGIHLNEMTTAKTQIQGKHNPRSFAVAPCARRFFFGAAKLPIVDDCGKAR